MSGTSWRSRCCQGHREERRRLQDVCQRPLPWCGGHGGTWAGWQNAPPPSSSALNERKTRLKYAHIQYIYILGWIPHITNSECTEKGVKSTDFPQVSRNLTCLLLSVYPLQCETGRRVWPTRSRTIESNCNQRNRCPNTKTFVCLLALSSTYTWNRARHRMTLHNHARLCGYTKDPLAYVWYKTFFFVLKILCCASKQSVFYLNWAFFLIVLYVNSATTNIIIL